jgi:RNA chaperone Hfq
MNTSRNFGNQAPRKFSPKGHDRILQRLQDEKHDIIVNVAGQQRIGNITGKDKFTITLSCSDGVTRLIYKHAIDEIELPEAF